jgi:hypothetical protein
MEGLMLVPPERGTIIGRAIWKVSLQSDESIFMSNNPPASICRPWHWSIIEDAERYPRSCGQFSKELDAQRSEADIFKAESGRCFTADP